MLKNKRLYRKQEDKVLAGICAGLGDYFSIDPVVLRLVYLILSVLTGVIPGVIVYIIAIYIVPKQPKADYTISPE